MKDLLAVSSALLSIVALFSFVALYTWAILLSWRARPAPNPNAVYLATALAGLVGGFVASAFGQKLPDTSRPPTSFFMSSAAYLGGIVTAKTGNADPAASEGTITSRIGMAYILAYFAVGLAAIATWAFAPAASDLVKNLALIALGLLIAIVGTYMHSVAPQVALGASLHRVNFQHTYESHFWVNSKASSEMTVLKNAVNLNVAF